MFGGTGVVSALVKIFVSGATGFVGRHLTRSLLASGHDVHVLSRDPEAAKRSLSVPSAVSWDGDLSEALSGCDAVVNLAGEPVAEARWTEERISAIRASRTRTTRKLTLAIAAARPRPKVWVSASAVGYYGHHEDDRLFDETSPAGTDTLAQICTEWEESAKPVLDAGVRLAIARIGIVLGADGGMLGRLVPLFRKFLGGPLGRGTQYISWIHLRDAVSAIRFAIEQEVEGPFNVTAPHPVNMNEFVRQLGDVLSRPSFLRVPAFALRASLGTGLSEILLRGQRVLPKKLEDLGFLFEFPRLYPALTELLASQAGGR